LLFFPGIVCKACQTLQPMKTVPCTNSNWMEKVNLGDSWLFLACDLVILLLFYDFSSMVGLYLMKCTFWIWSFSDIRLA